MGEKAEVIIRRAERDDAAKLADLCGQLGYPSTQEQVAERLKVLVDDRDHAIFVAEMGGEVVGWVQALVLRLLVEDAQAQIGGLVVDEAHRNQKIGEKLMEAAEEWTREQGLRRVYVTSNIKRERAHKFYERIGYEKLKTSFAFTKIVSHPKRG